MPRATALFCHAIAAVLLLGGCAEAGDIDLDGVGAEPLRGSETPSGLEFAVADTVRAGRDTIRLVLTNESSDPLGHNLCYADLERREGGRWSAVRRTPEASVCTAELRILEAGYATYADQPVYEFIQPGLYRFRASVEWPLGAGTVGLISNEFIIAE